MLYMCKFLKGIAIGQQKLLIDENSIVPKINFVNVKFMSC